MSELQLRKHFRTVALDEIEHTLDRLWREVTEAALTSGGSAVSRNTVLTLVAYTDSAAQAEAALNASEELTIEHPARTIVVCSDPDRASTSVDARVAIHSEGTGPSAAYGEEILIDAQGDAARHIPGVVLPLTMSGLPVFLWWMSEPPWGSTLIETFVDGCDRLIIDSCEATDADRSLVAAADLMRRKHERCALSDFSWTRQAPWRELTAQFYDAPELRPYLASIDHVTVEYAAGDEDAPSNSAQAYLYVGWLASRLGWTLPSTFRRGYGATRQHTLHDSNGRSVLVEVNARFGLRTTSWRDVVQPARPAPPQLDPSMADGRVDGQRLAGSVGESSRAIGRGALMSVRLHALHERRPGTFIIARDQDLAHATTLCQVDRGGPPSHTVHLPSLGETTHLGSQLEELGHDTIYEAALTTAARLVGGESRRGTP